MSASDVVAEEYASSLSDLVANSKPLINMLTMLAEENIDHAPAIVQAVERHLQQVRSDIKLPVLYLIDSIVKNVRQAYTGLFTQNIVSTFCSVFEKVDEKTRAQMFKLRQTWNDVFPPKKLYAMDVRVNSIDPAWPITAPVPTTSIHINPKFFPKPGNPHAPIVNPLPSLQSGQSSTSLIAASAVPEDPQAIAEAKMREQLLKKQKKLLELQQKKLELELLQTKAKLEEQQKQLERQTDHLHLEQLILPVNHEVPTKMFGTSAIDMSAAPLSVKSEHTLQPVRSLTQVPGVPQSVPTPPVSGAVTSSTGPSRSPSKKSEGSISKAKSTGKPVAGPGGNSSRSRDPRLATRQPVPAQPNVVNNVTSENMQQPISQLALLQDNTSSVFETVKLETAKPKPQITINIANKGNANKEPQGVSKKDPRLNSNKVHVSNSKIRSSESKSSGPSKGPSKPPRGPSPLPASQSPSRSSKPAPLPRKLHGKGSSSNSNKVSHKSASVIDLTDSPPHKASEKKEEELAEKDKDSHSESLSKSSSSSSSSGSSSSPGSKKDNHKNKSSGTSSRQSPLDKKKSSEKVGKVSEIGSGSNVSIRRVKSPGGSSRRSRERERDRSVSKKFDMFEPEADSPSPPPPPVISDNKKREDTSFKAVKVSKKGRNYVLRNRRDESQSPEVSGVSSGDVDLRLGAPPEKHPRMGVFPADSSASSTEDESKKTLVDATTKDVDLRQLSRSPTKKRPSMERSEQPPNKKSKAEMIDVLFGNEDVDLRQLAPISVVTQPGMPPSPPPPPIISQPSPTQPASNQDGAIGANSPKIQLDIDNDASSESKNDSLLEDGHPGKENGEGKSFCGWEKYKESKPDIYKSPFRPHKPEIVHKSSSPSRDSIYNSRDRVSHFNRHIGERMEYDGLGRPLLYHRFHDNMGIERRHHHGQNAVSSPIGEDTDMRTHLLDPDTLEDVEMNISIIIQQADEQLKNGSMNFAEYNTLLKQVIHINEMQKLREAKRRDQQENKESWERNRRRGDLGKASPQSDDENSRDSLPGGRFGDIDERFPVLKARVPQTSSVPPSPPDPQWNDMQSHHGRPGMWEQHPHPWARGMGPPGSLGPMPGPQFPRMMHGGPFHRQPGPGQDFAPGPNNFGSMPRWRPGQFNRPPFEGDMDGRPGFRFEQYNMRFPRGSGPQPPLNQQQPPPQQPPQQPPQPLQQQPQQQQQQQQQQQLPAPTQPLKPPTPQQLANGELPLADSLLLEAIAQDSMRTINIDGVPREIRFYGDTAVVMLAWDDPREIGFQGGSRCITFDDRETILCSFNEPYREFVLDGCKHSIRLGAPTRELYVDGKWYECFFGGPPFSVEMGGKIRLVKLEGPPPQVKIGLIKRTDLVAGKINLIINARNMVPIFLDAKPQRFDIEGKPHILRFTHALTNVQINGRSFKVEFGGLPKPIVVRGKKHFIRFSVLPRGIQPGYINIVNMEGERLPSPSHADGDIVEAQTFSPHEENDEAKLRKVNEPALPMLGRTRPRRFGGGQESPNDSDAARNSPAGLQSENVVQKQPQPVTSQLPLEMLTSLMPVAMAPSSGYSYQVEQDSQDTQTKPASDSAIPVSGVPLAAAAAAVVVAAAAGATSISKVSKDSTTPVVTTATPTASTGVTAAGIPFLLPEINVDELFQKLVATGIVSTPSSATEEAKKKKDDDMDTVKYVDFSQPETLKVRQPALISALYSGIQCSSCGVRFAPEQTMKYSQHLDWHFRQNRRDRDNTRKAQSRKWYYDISDWIQFEEIEDLEERAQSWFETQQAAEGKAEEKEPIEVPSVPAGDSSENIVCDVCHDKFEQFYNEETEEWHLRLAIRVDGKTYHPLCYEDLKTNLERSLEESVVTDETKPEESEKDGEKASKESMESDAEDKKEEEEESKEVDSSVPADSTAEEPEGPSEEIAQEQSGKEEVEPLDDAVDNLSAEIKTEAMQVVECDSTVVKTEETEVETPMDEEASPTVVPKVDTTHTEVACSIDGNVKFEDKPQASIAGPISGKIKINITKPLPAPIRESQSEGDAESSAAEGDPDDGDEAQVPVQIEGLTIAEIKDVAKETTLEQEFPEPPPPGIEPVRLKPRLVGRKLTEMPPVMKGTELSGLCSIM